MALNEWFAQRFAKAKMFPQLEAIGTYKVPKLRKSAGAAQEGKDQARVVDPQHHN